MRCTMAPLIVLFLAAAAASSPDAATPADAAAHPDGGAAPRPTVNLAGQVVDGKGRAVSEVVAFAVERGSSRIAGAMRPDPDGFFVMKLGATLHDFGILSSRWQLGGVERISPTAVKIVAYPAF